MQGYYTPSSTVPVNFGHIAAGWFGVTAGLFIVFCLVYLILRLRHDPHFLTRYAWLRRIYFVIIQALTIPAGTFIAHSFPMQRKQSS